MSMDWRDIPADELAQLFLDSQTESGFLAAVDGKYHVHPDEHGIVRRLWRQMQALETAIVREGR